MLKFAFLHWSRLWLHFDQSYKFQGGDVSERATVFCSAHFKLFFIRHSYMGFPKFGHILTPQTNHKCTYFCLHSKDKIPSLYNDYVYGHLLTNKVRNIEFLIQKQQMFYQVSKNNCLRKHERNLLINSYLKSISFLQI